VAIFVMKDDYILYQQHVMWYESEIVKDSLDSLENALKHTKLRIRIKICLNGQTYIETPNENINQINLLKEIANHPVLKCAEIVYKTNEDPFYNIGDWRRDVYDPNAKYTIWGESDCIMPVDFLYTLEKFFADTTPHVISLASRKMWDDTWLSVEHVNLRKYTHRKNTVNRFLPKKMYLSDIITQQELDDYNNMFENIDIEKSGTVKIDGALLGISGGLSELFIPLDMHFAREDTCLENFCIIKKIPQYVIATRIKGHNYHSPKKRINTTSTRDDAVYKIEEKKSKDAMERFTEKLIESLKKNL
jgi:hypothetical protein